jgi:hypothetical protein
VVLGGRRALHRSPPSTDTGTPDIDLYAFCQQDVLDHIPHALDILQGAGVRLAFRVRSTFVEAHYLPATLPEIDLKVMGWDTVDAILMAPPNLDELYLEKMHSLHNYKIIVDEAGEGRHRIDHARRRRPADIQTLLPYAFESYLKHAWGVAKQGLQRHQPLIGASLAHRALGFLVIIEYLLNGFYPPPFKWRMHESELSVLRRGRVILDVANWLEVMAPPMLDLYVHHLRGLETQIFCDPGMRMVRGTAPDGWWWAP